MASQTRQIARLQKHLEEAQTAIKALTDQLAGRGVEIHRLESEKRFLEARLKQERNTRVYAQRGLVDYMREHGLGDRIGYDPDADPEVLQAIAEGTIPARDTPKLSRARRRAADAQLDQARELIAAFPKPPQKSRPPRRIRRQKMAV